MLDFINGSLVFSVGIALILIWLLVRQNARMPAISIFAYMLFLMALDILVVLYLLNSHHLAGNLLAARIRLIIQCFLLAILHYYATGFTYSRNFPKPSPVNRGVFAAALMLSLTAFTDWLVRPVPNSPVPQYTAYFTAFVIYFGGVVALTGNALIRKYRSLAALKRTDTFIAGPIKVIFPLAALLLGLVYPGTFFYPEADFLYSGYLGVSLLALYSALRFQLLELTESTQFLLSQIANGGVFLILFYALFPQARELGVILVTIPGFLGTMLLGYYAGHFFAHGFRKVPPGMDKMLDHRIEKFSRDIVRLLDTEQVWRFLETFCRETFGFSRMAVVTPRRDVLIPYEITYLSGFAREDIEAVLNHEAVKLMELVDEGHPVLNRFEFPHNSPVYGLLDEKGIYVVLSLIGQDALLGLIFLGGDRQFMPLLPRHLHLLKIIRSQIARAISNIHAIEEIVQSRKMAEIGQMAAHLAHDFRSFIALVKQHNQGNELLLRHARYMERMVGDLLSYSRPPELNRTAVQVNQLLDFCLERVEIPSHITVEKHYAPELPRVHLDMHQMQRVFINLLENSVRAMRTREQGRIKLTTRLLTPVQKSHPTPWVYIEILDEGVGIPQEFHSRLFEPFFTTYKTEGGNGLGLAIARQIVTQHGGYIDFSSGAGKGTAFYIRIPCQPATDVQVTTHQE